MVTLRSRKFTWFYSTKYVLRVAVNRLVDVPSSNFSVFVLRWNQNSSCHVNTSSKIGPPRTCVPSRTARPHRSPRLTDMRSPRWRSYASMWGRNCCTKPVSCCPDMTTRKRTVVLTRTIPLSIQSGLILFNIFLI